MATFSFGSHSVITGGTFTQVNNNVLARSSQNPWDCLKSAVAPAAFHNSAERFDPLRCHPNTRVALMNELRDLALRRGNTDNARLLWMSGPAGAGKSAIAQSFCEECFAAELLLASFFFNRSDPTRNTARSFVATLVYQIYGKVPAHHQSLILSVIENDPLIFERSIDAQFKLLIMGPLQVLSRGGHFLDDIAPRLIVIDGLDECSSGPIQVGILKSLEYISMHPDCPFVFVVTSRPEHDIEIFFRSSGLGPLFHRLVLDHSYLPDADIELFLREKIQETCATHLLKKSIPQGWPSSEAIEDLVQKSSGQFIYASVVVKYITSNRHYPPNRLDVVRRLCPPKRDLPFAELDALYSHIFSRVRDITLVLRILRIILLNQCSSFAFSPENIEELCELDRGECLGALCDLQSVLQVDPCITFLHKSLPDYLQDPTRSRDYHIDTAPGTVVPIVTQCLSIISDGGHNLGYLFFVLDNLNLLISNISLCHEQLMSFCLPRSHVSHATASKATLVLRTASLWFTFDFLDKICTLEGTTYAYIYHHHIHQFPELVDQLAEILFESPDNHNHIIPMIVTFILLGNLDTQISQKVFDFLRQIPFKHLSNSLFVELSMAGLENLSCAAARRCIHLLIHDDSPTSAAFALEWLPQILQGCALSPDLNGACLPARPFAYAATGDHGLSELADHAYQAMQEYRERYEKRLLEAVLESA